jgi:MFS family permease
VTIRAAVAPQDAGECPSAASAWFSVAILSTVYMFSYLDRQILVLLVKPVRADLGISDTQFSLLTGAAFALFYTVAALPLSTLADRRSRKRLIMIGVAVWGTMTMLCGVARTYGQLFAARMGVGLGEATLTPTVYAMIPDLFPPQRVARAMSVFVLGTFMGSALSLVLGGLVIGRLGEVEILRLPLLGMLKPWQIVFLVVGGATLLLLVPLALLREPARRRAAAAERGSILPAICEVAQRGRDYSALFVGVPFASLIVYGMQAWLPTLFERAHGWTAEQAGLRLGMLTLGAGLVGTLGGGALADRWHAAGRRDATVRLNAILLLAALPLPAVIGLAPSAAQAMAGCAAFFLISSMTIPLAPLALQLVTPPALRARVSALFLLVVNVGGILLGPTAVALATDHLFGDDLAVGRSIALVGTICYALAALAFLRGLDGFRTALERSA